MLELAKVMILLKLSLTKFGGCLIRELVLTATVIVFFTLPLPTRPPVAQGGFPMPGTPIPATLAANQN